jgi:amidase
MAPSYDVAGWFAVGPGIFRKIGAVLLAGKSATAAIERTVILEDAFAQADPEVNALLQRFIASCDDAIPAPSKAQIAPKGLDPWREAFRVVQAREIWEIYGPFITKHKPTLGPGIKERMEFASAVTEEAAAAAREVVARGREEIRNMAKPGTILALPPAPCIAPLTTTPPGDLESFRVRVMRLTCIAGISGLPQVTIPIGTVSGCPIGLSFIGWAGGDEVLLDLAVALAPYVGAAG